MASGNWTWLEVAKLIAGLLTPAMILLGGIYIHRITKRFEHTQWRSQKLIEKRLAIYDEVAPVINDILTYYTYLGSWRDRSPSSVVDLKRELDKKVHLAAPLFSPAFFAACMSFQNLCYKTYGGWGQDAKLRTSYKRRQECWIGQWDSGWNTLFSEDVAEPEEIKDAYQHVMDRFAEDIGVYPTYVIPRSGRIPMHL